jgi:cell division protease FtsH
VPISTASIVATSTVPRTKPPGDETTGAENDIRQATELARSMVGRFGMSDEIGFVSVLPQEGDGWAMGVSQVSERTRQRIDDEVKRVVEEAHVEAIRLLTENRSRLDGIAEALLREETLDQPHAYAAAGLASPPEDEAAPVQAAIPIAT